MALAEWAWVVVGFVYAVMAVVVGLTLFGMFGIGHSNASMLTRVAVSAGYGIAWPYTFYRAAKDQRRI